MVSYQTPKPPRFRKELVPGGYEFVIPAKKNWFALLFLTVWLIFWTIGGVAAMWALASDREPFVAIWLVLWAFGWIFAAGQIGYMLSGAEFIRFVRGDLEIGFRVPLFHRTRRYRGSEISRLAASEGQSPLGAWMRGMSYGPFLNIWQQPGVFRFNHGARTIYAGAALDLAEGEIIVADLIRSLPNAR
jgi:hypothetical protein